MRLRRRDVLAEQVLVEIDGSVDIFHDRIGTRRESSAPHLVAHDTFTEILTAMPDRPEQGAKRPRYRRATLIAAAIIAGLVVGFAGVYEIGGFKPNGDIACRATSALLQKLKPLARGEVAAVSVPDRPVLVPDLAFRDAEGKARQLADWRGKTVLVNLWATWCVPCRKEMPALDALQQRAGGPNFQVVTINIDTRDLEKPKTWLKEVGVSHLEYFADPNAKVFQDLKAVGRAFGMPTTLLIDANGCELGTIAGPAEWASEDAIRLVNAAAGKS
jgi:thiol-disulfide isomerase/thioredoxin